MWAATPLMSALSSALSSNWLPAAISAGGQFLSNSQQNAFSAEQYANRYQTTVKDLQAAGLNPMLAYTQGAGQAPQGNFQNAAGRGVDSYLQAKLNSAQVANIAADTANKAAQANLWNAQAQQATASAGQSQANVDLINEQVGKVRAEIDKIKGDTNFVKQQDILVQTAWNLRQQGVAAQERGMTEGQQRALMSQTIEKLIQETRIAKFDADAIDATINSGRVAKELKPILELLRFFLKK